MNEDEELLAKAWACLSEASKIQDPVLRAKVLALVYRKGLRLALCRQADPSREVRCRRLTGLVADPLARPSWTQLGHRRVPSHLTKGVLPMQRFQI
jgi:hypothetical protein